MKNDTYISPTPQENMTTMAVGQKIIRGAENSEPIFSGESLPAIPDNTGNLQNDTKFAPGVSGNPRGRPRGARNKLTELFLNTIIDDFAEHGADTLARLRAQDPAMYIKFIAVLVPKSLIREYEAEPDVDYADMTQEEVVRLLENVQRRRFVEKAIETVAS